MSENEILENVIAQFRKKKEESERMASYHANIFLTTNEQRDRNEGLLNLSKAKHWQEAIDIVRRELNS